MDYLGDVYLPGQLKRGIDIARKEREQRKAGSELRPDSTFQEKSFDQWASETFSLVRTWRVTETDFDFSLQNKLDPIKDLFNQSKFGSRGAEFELKNRTANTPSVLNSSEASNRNAYNALRQMANVIDLARRASPEEWQSERKYIDLLTKPIRGTNRRVISKDDARRVVRGQIDRIRLTN